MMTDAVYEIHRKDPRPVKVVEIDIDSDNLTDAIVAMLESQGKQVSEVSEFVGTDGHTYIRVCLPSYHYVFELTPEEIHLKRHGGQVQQRGQTIQPKILFRVEGRNPLRVVQLSQWSSDILPPALKEGS